MLKQAEMQSNNSVTNLIPDPVNYAMIKFMDNGKEIMYTDCWQISVLRFLHLIFGEGGKINYQRLVKFMDQKNLNSKKLIQYFKKNENYHFDKAFYQTPEGLLIRSEWCQFLNQSKLLNLKKDEKKYEVAATLPNLISFYLGFFPQLKIDLQSIKVMSYQNITNNQMFKSYENVLNQIYKQLSCFGFKIQMKLVSNFIDYQDYFFFSSIQNIYIDGKHLLDWQIYEDYQLKDKVILQRYSGHSDYRCAAKL